MKTPEKGPAPEQSPIDKAKEETIAKFEAIYPDVDVRGMVDEMINDLKAEGLIAQRALAPEERFRLEDVSRDTGQHDDLIRRMREVSDEN